jgi:hypothetical protein
VTTLDKQASKKVKNIKKQAIATQACETILEEIVQSREEEETRDARAAALEEAKEVANAKAEAAKNFDPFDDPKDVAGKDISAKGTMLAGAKGGVSGSRTAANPTSARIKRSEAEKTTQHAMQTTIYLRSYATTARAFLQLNFSS